MMMMTIGVSRAREEDRLGGGEKEIKERQKDNQSEGKTDTYLREWFLASSGCLSCRISKMLGCRRNATILSL